MATEVGYDIRAMSKPQKRNLWMMERAAYTAERAAALAGVPKSTVHYWAREGVLVPSVSEERVKLWSFADLMKLRLINWLRQDKERPDGKTITGTSMGTIRRALGALADLDLELWTEDSGPSVQVDRGGRIVIQDPTPRGTEVGRWGELQIAQTDVLDLTKPFSMCAGHVGPDLHAPRQSLRIVPGKLAGAPHVINTRVETEALAALNLDGMPIEAIHSLYPALSVDAIAEALDLEAQLQRNVAAA